MKLILEDVLGKVLKSLERGYLDATIEYHYVADDSELNDVLNNENEYVVFFGKKALIPREDLFRKKLKESLNNIEFKLKYIDFVYDNRGNIVNLLLSVQMNGCD